MAELVCRVVSELPELAGLADAWQDLADRALEANPFYEPNFLLPMIRETGPFPGLEVWVICQADRMLGFFVFHRRKVGPATLLSPFSRGRSVPREIDIDLGVPLVDRDRANEVIDALLDQLDRHWLFGIDWYCLAEDGGFYHALAQRLAVRRQPVIDLDGWVRPILRPHTDAASYLEATVSKRRKQTMDRYRRHLARTGPVSFDRLRAEDAVDPWIETHFRLEASGWKGRQGTDIGATEGSRRFFAEVMRARHAMGALHAYRFLVGDLPVAQTWVLQPADRSVGLLWKTAYDDAFAKDSPGLQMEIEAIALMHDAVPPMAAIDSCAQRKHAMWGWLWRDKRQLVCLLVLARSPLHRLVVQIAPPLRRWRQARRARQMPEPNEREDQET